MMMVCIGSTNHDEEYETIHGDYSPYNGEEEEVQGNEGDEQ